MTLSLIWSAVILGLIIMGSGVMSLAIFKTRKITALLKRSYRSEPSSNVHTSDIVHTSDLKEQSWHYLSVLMMFFLGGYCLAVYLISHEKFGWLPLLTGTVFFFGALFVLFSVSLYAQTLHQLIASESMYRTERDRAAEALSQVQRTQMLLVHNEKMLSLGQLSAGLAHEINNPVNFIHGNLRHVENYTQDLFSLIEAYRDAVDVSRKEDIASLEQDIELAFIKPDLAKILGSMNAGTQRIRDIVHSMRTFSRLDESQCKQADLTQGLESALVMLQSQLSKSDKPIQLSDSNAAESAACVVDSSFEIEVDKDFEEISPVECDHGAVNQVFLHILSNAADSFLLRDDSHKEVRERATSPKITVSTRQLRHNWVQIAISDNGSGIDSTNLCHIFDPFFTTKPIGKGTGLGLATSHQIIVEQHKGRLQCESEVGVGTTFTIDIPVARTNNLLDISQ